jgi:hypothetical protein
MRSARLRACEHCHAVGYLVGHGRVMGFSETSSERVLRGHRLLCSKRYRQRGCGQTMSVLLGSCMKRFVARAATAFLMASALARGVGRAEAWRGISAMSVSTGYRLARHLTDAQVAIRTALSSRGPPPDILSEHPLAQTLEHLRAVLGKDATFETYQLAFQSGLLG